MEKKTDQRRGLDEVWISKRTEGEGQGDEATGRREGGLKRGAVSWRLVSRVGPEARSSRDSRWACGHLVWDHRCGVVRRPSGLTSTENEDLAKPEGPRGRKRGSF